MIYRAASTAGYRNMMQECRNQCDDQGKEVAKQKMRRAATVLQALKS